jgi:hypothetical protein
VTSDKTCDTTRRSIIRLYGDHPGILLTRFPTRRSRLKSGCDVMQARWHRPIHIPRHFRICRVLVSGGRVPKSRPPQHETFGRDHVRWRDHGPLPHLD